MRRLVAARGASVGAVHVSHKGEMPSLHPGSADTSPLAALTSKIQMLEMQMQACRVFRPSRDYSRPASRRCTRAAGGMRAVSTAVNALTGVLTVPTCDQLIGARETTADRGECRSPLFGLCCYSIFQGDSQHPAD